MLKRSVKWKWLFVIIFLVLLSGIILFIYSSREKSEVCTDVEFVQQQFPNIKDIEEVKYYYKVKSDQREIGLQDIEFCGFIKVGEDFYDKITRDCHWKETKKLKKLNPKQSL